MTLSGPGRKRHALDADDAIELVLGDLDAVDHQDAGVLVGEVDRDVVDQTGELVRCRVDAFDVGGKRGWLPLGVLSASGSAGGCRG